MPVFLGKRRLTMARKQIGRQSRSATQVCLKARVAFEAERPETTPRQSASPTSADLRKLEAVAHSLHKQARIAASEPNTGCYTRPKSLIPNNSVGTGEIAKPLYGQKLYRGF